MSKARLTKEKKPAVVGEAKPAHVFYVWYTELCRRAGTQPLNYVKPARPKNENVLDFVADRIKPEEWIPLLSALRRDTSLHVIAIHSRAKCKFLDDVDCPDKIKLMKRRAGSLHTAYVCRSLVKTLTNCLLHSQVLSSLELDGVPIGVEDIEVLVAALQQNKVIKVLAFKYSNVGNLGCQILCSALRQMPNIEVLNLSGCKLDAKSAQAIAKVVKTQQISRYCESWHNSLRYEDPDVGIMAGLRRITLNNNPGISDQGLIFILDELDDDLWIKALDMQRCGVTEAVSQRLLDVVEYSRSLEIADFRNNNLEAATIERIFDLLKEKRNFSSVSEFKWCFTTTSLTSSALPETQSKCSVFYPAGKSRSVPVKNIPAVASCSQLRRTKTNTMLTSNPSVCTTPHLSKTSVSIDSSSRPEFARSITSLNSKLQRETSKRIRMEQENRKLKDELERMRAAFISIESNVSIAKERTVQFNPMPRKKISSTKTKPKKDEAMRADHTIKPAMNVEFIFDSASTSTNTGYSILQTMAKNKADSATACAIDESEREIQDYFEDTVIDYQSLRGAACANPDNDDVDDLSDEGSQASLIKFMCELKSTQP